MKQLRYYLIAKSSPVSLKRHWNMTSAVPSFSSTFFKSKVYPQFY